MMPHTATNIDTAWDLREFMDGCDLIFHGKDGVDYRLTATVPTDCEDIVLDAGFQPPTGLHLMVSLGGIRIGLQDYANADELFTAKILKECAGQESRMLAFLEKYSEDWRALPESERDRDWEWHLERCDLAAKAAFLTKECGAFHCPVWCHRHGTVSLSLSQACHWDSGQCGLVYIDPAHVKQLDSLSHFVLEYLADLSDILNGNVYSWCLWEHSEDNSIPVASGSLHTYTSLFCRQHEESAIRDEISDIVRCYIAPGSVIYQGDKHLVSTL